MYRPRKHASLACYNLRPATELEIESERLRAVEVEAAAATAALAEERKRAGYALGYIALRGRAGREAAEEVLRKHEFTPGWEAAVAAAHVVLRR